MSPHSTNDNMINSLAVVGTVASWTLQGVLGLLATVCTIIVVGPKALEQVTAWCVKAKIWLDSRKGSRGDE
jgi:hypothetical protein